MAGFKNLEDLVGDLDAGLRKLRAGQLEPEELTPLVMDARELCDRLVLLRFKAHEFSYEVRRKAPQGGVDDALADRQPVRPFRIGAAYQTSLIDAIEEVSREQAEEERMAYGPPGLFDMMPDPEPASADLPEADLEDEPHRMTMAEPEPVVVPDPVEPPPAPAPEPPVSLDPGPPADPAPEEPAPKVDPSPTLAEQMERQPIGDLRRAFSLVEKYECIKMLFSDDAVEFNRVLEALEEAGNFELARHWLGQHVESFGEWDQEDPVVQRFLDKVERRYH